MNYFSYVTNAGDSENGAGIATGKNNNKNKNTDTDTLKQLGVYLGLF